MVFSRTWLTVSKLILVYIEQILSGIIGENVIKWRICEGNLYVTEENKTHEIVA